MLNSIEKNTTEDDGSLLLMATQRNNHLLLPALPMLVKKLTSLPSVMSYAPLIVGSLNTTFSVISGDMN